MSETTPFCAGLRHESNTSPGSFAKIVYADPELEDSADFANRFKVTFNEERSRVFMERIWNMETWDSLFHVNIEFTYIDTPEPYNHIFDWSLTGQFNYAFVEYDAFFDSTKILEGGVYLPKPQDRTAGSLIRTARTTVTPDDTDPETLSYDQTTLAALMPDVFILTYVGRPTGIDPQGLSLDIKLEEDEMSPVLGDVTFALSPDGGDGGGTHQTYLDARVLKIWLKPDGTITAYFDLRFLHDYSSEIVIELGNPESDFTGDYPDAAFEAVNLDLCGQVVPAKLWHYSYGPFPSGLAIDSFTFEYKVNESTQYTYPVDE